MIVVGKNIRQIVILAKMIAFSGLLIAKMVAFSGLAKMIAFSGLAIRCFVKMARMLTRDAKSLVKRIPTLTI